MQTLGAFSAQQKEYLEGFLRGLASVGTPSSPSSPATAAASADAGSSDDAPPGRKARLAWLAAGKRLSREEKIKHEGDPLDCWPRIEELSAQDKLPEGEDLYRFKTHGLWNVSPAQASMMSRLRVPGGVLASAQALAIAKAADDFGGGYVDLTTRANLQIREIPGRHMADLLTALHEAGITPRGSGADNIRNVTGNPTAGIDRHEFIDVLPLCRKLHHAILHDRTLYGLPRKFNVAFDGGNSISSLEDTNDIGLKAVRVDMDHPGDGAAAIQAGVYFRLALGGITGHLDLARDTGFLLKPEECLPVIKAILQVYIEHGDRGNRKKARLKYVLDAFGFAKFMGLVQEKVAFPLRTFPLEKCRLAPAVDKGAHLGVHAQKQAGLSYVGVDVPVGRLGTAQLSGLARLADRCGSGSLRLTVWQNLLIPDISADRLEEVLAGLRALGLSHAADPVAAGLIACTGSEGCQFGQAATKSTALAISAHLKGLNGRIALDAPVNIHLTGCPHSCAQHFIGDIGLIATKVEKDGYRGGGFHFFVGGGYGKEGRMAVAVTRSVPVPEVPGEIERLLKVYLDRRLPGESFTAFTARHADAEIPSLFADQSVAGSANAAAVAASADPALDVAAGRRPA